MSSIKIRSQRHENHTEIRLLIKHPMENGRNRDPANGELIPAHFIEEITINHNEIVAINIHLAGSISKNPFFTFRLKSVSSGDKITVSWRDNLQQSDNALLVVE